jgi:hypothetical protein
VSTRARSPKTRTCQTKARTSSVYAPLRCFGSRWGCIVFPSFRGIFHAFKGILEQQMPRFIRLYGLLPAARARSIW